MIIAIDGPAASGKGTLGKRLAAHYHYRHLDTGLIYRAVAKAMMLEAQQIGQHFGAHFRVDVERRINGAAGVGAHRTSMLQDLDKKRPLEIDALLTSVQEMGHLANVKTPYIDTVLALVQQMGRSNGVYPTFPEEVRTPEVVTA